MPFVKGQSGNPGGRPKGFAKVRKLARVHTKAAIETLASIMLDADQHPGARVAAAKELLDRGHGKAMQSVELSGAVKHEHSGLNAARRREVLAALGAAEPSATTH